MLTGYGGWIVLVLFVLSGYSIYLTDRTARRARIRASPVSGLLSGGVYVAAVCGWLALLLLGGQLQTGGSPAVVALSVVGISAYLGGLYFVPRGLSRLVDHLRDRRRPIATASSVEPGRVVVTGQAVPVDGPVTAPLTGREAVCYFAETKQFEKRPVYRTRGIWRSVDQEWSDNPFHVDDGTGRVLVDPQGAEVRFGPDAKRETDVGVDDPVPDRFEQYLDAAGLDERGGRGPTVGGWGFGRDRRYTEYVLEPGTRVTVSGVAESDFSGENPDDLVVTGAPVIEVGTPDELRENRTRGALRYAAGGLAVAAAGYVALLVATGVI